MHVHEPHILVRTDAQHITSRDHRTGRAVVAPSMQEAIARLGAR